jgi:hypothetical protein
MGLGIFSFILAVVLLASLNYQADSDRIQRDYQRWKNNRK